jgi:hypothetical protein
VLVQRTPIVVVWSTLLDSTPGDPKSRVAVLSTMQVLVMLTVTWKDPVAVAAIAFPASRQQRTVKTSP